MNRTGRKIARREWEGDISGAFEIVKKLGTAFVFTTAMAKTECANRSLSSCANARRRKQILSITASKARLKSAGGSQPEIAS